MVDWISFVGRGQGAGAVTAENQTEKCFERSPSRKSYYFNYLVNANKPSVFLAQNEALTTYKESVNVVLCLEGLKNLVSKGTVIHK